MWTRRAGVGVVAALAVLLTGWTGVSAAGNDGSRLWPMVGMLALAVGALGAGVVVGAHARLGIALVAAVGVLVALLANPDALRGSAVAGPLGYGNANAALGVQGLVAACIVLVSVTETRRRLAAGALVGALVVVTVLIRSAAADAVALGVLLAAGWTVVTGGAHARAAAVATAGLLVACVVSTAVAGATYHAAARQSVAERALTSRRVSLWHDAVSLLAEHPVLGVGPRRFPAESPTARRDADTRQAHSEFLQTGAEGGVPALVLLVALVICVLACVAGAPAPEVAVVGVAGVGALVIHGSVDYVLQFPAVVAVAALLAGTTAAAPSRRWGPRRESPG